MMTEIEKVQRIQNLEEIIQRSLQKLEFLLGRGYFWFEEEIDVRLKTLITAEKGFSNEAKYIDLSRKIQRDVACAEYGIGLLMTDFNRLSRENLAAIEVICEELDEQMPFAERYRLFFQADPIDRVLLLGISNAFEYMYYYAVGKGREKKDAFLQFSRAKKIFDYYMNYEDCVENEASVTAEMLFAVKDTSGLLMDEEYFCRKIRACLQYMEQDSKREAFARALSITGCFEAERLVLSAIKKPSKDAVDRMMILAEYLLNIKNE